MTADIAPASRLVHPATAAPRFSVVIPALNEEAVIGACLESLAAQRSVHRVEVIVVDNGSTDQTAAVARRHGARVVHEPRPGVCYARQRGLKSATGEIVVTSDADTTFAPGWLQGIDDEFRRDPAVVAVAGPCLYVQGPWWGEVWCALLFGVVAGLAGLTGRVLYVTATNLAFSRGAFEGYDTRLTQGGDELDVLRRLRRRGRVVFANRRPTRTSSRRLERGLVYTLLVSLCFHYLVSYTVNRVARKTVLGTAPACRPPDRGAAANDVALSAPGSRHEARTPGS